MRLKIKMSATFVTPVIKGSWPDLKKQLTDQKLLLPAAFAASAP